MRTGRIRCTNKNSRFAVELISPVSTERNQAITLQSTSRQTVLQPPAPSNKDILKRMKIKYLVNSLINNVRYLSPPHTTPANIEQNWQTDINQEKHQNKNDQQHSKQTLTQQLNHKFQLFKHLNLVQGLIIVLFCWLITVSVVFQIKTGIQIFIIAFIFSSGRTLFLSGYFVKSKDNQSNGFVFDPMQDFGLPFLRAMTCLFFIIRYQFNLGFVSYIIQLIGFITVVIQFRRIDHNFQNIVKYAQQNRMKKQLRIIQLFLLVITLAHIFGLIMYAMHHMSPDGTNWLSKIHLDDQQWNVQYIYCFYWAITTMVTVGYGDITPSNHYQVLVVMCIQLIGTAVFGYMINVIGITVDQIKKKDQQFQNYQQTIQKLRDHYQLSRQLCHKMKYDIKMKQNQFKNIPLKTSEQKDFLDYIQPNLKQEFVLETNMKVIKKSIFFLTHFSVNFQNQIALKLTRIIYKPHDQIVIFDQNKQRSMVIINNGHVNVFIQKQHNNISITKKVRQIKSSQNSLVMNVFGYSSLIVNRDISLRAIATQTAVSYVLKRKDFLQCIQKSMLDFQSFNQMRQKITFVKKLQEVEAPSLKSKQNHYIPNIFIIMKKIKYQNQYRNQYKRAKKRTKLKFTPNTGRGNNVLNRTTARLQNQQTMIKFDIETFIFEEDDFQTMKSIKSIGSRKNLDDQNNFNYQAIKLNDKVKIDQYKVFQNFMKGSNLPIVAALYEKSGYKKSYNKRIRSSLLMKPGVFGQMINKKKHIDKIIQRY